MLFHFSYCLYGVLPHLLNNKVAYALTLFFLRVTAEYASRVLTTPWASVWRGSPRTRA